MVILKFVLKTNYLHIQNEFFLKSYVYYFCFLQITIFLSYQISFPSIQIHLRGQIGVLAFVGKGDEMEGDVSNNIANHMDEPDGYWSNHVTYDNLEATYCTILLTVFRYLIWVWHGKIIIKIDIYQENHNHFMVDCISCTIHVSRLHYSRKKHVSMTGIIWF